MARTRAVVSDYDKRDGSKRPLERRTGIGSVRPSARGGRRGGVGGAAGWRRRRDLSPLSPVIWSGYARYARPLTGSGTYLGVRIHQGLKYALFFYLPFFCPTFSPYSLAVAYLLGSRLPFPSPPPTPPSPYPSSSLPSPYSSRLPSSTNLPPFSSPTVFVSLSPPPPLPFPLPSLPPSPHLMRGGAP